LEIEYRYIAGLLRHRNVRLNGHDPYRYLKDVLERLRLTTQPASRIGELLPHSWTPAAILS
jgi:transposase